MRLSSVLSVVKSGTVVTVFDYISEQVYANTEVENILDNSYYHQTLKNCRVYGIDPNGNELEVRILLED